MRRALGRGALWGLPVLAILASAAVAEPPERVKLAQDVARAHAAWPPGRDWLARNLSKAGQLVIPVLNRCVPDSPDGELTAFSIYMRLSQTGKILEVVTDVDVELGLCMTKEGRQVQLPRSPREDFWIQLNLAATL
jgi:hypothetical protein